MSWVNIWKDKMDHAKQNAHMLWFVKDGVCGVPDQAFWVDTNTAINHVMTHFLTYYLQVNGLMHTIIIIHSILQYIFYIILDLPFNYLIMQLVNASCHCKMNLS
jgi:hypothetical protein